jgi:hypothetical protein
MGWFPIDLGAKRSIRSPVGNSVQKRRVVVFLSLHRELYALMKTIQMFKEPWQFLWSMWQYDEGTI